MAKKANRPPTGKKEDRRNSSRGGAELTGKYTLVEEEEGGAGISRSLCGHFFSLEWFA